MTVSNASSKRLFVGNLFPEVTSNDLQKLFSRFGFRSAEIKNKSDVDGNVVSTFAFVDLSDASGESAVRDCIRECNGVRWKQRSIRVQAAQESFMQRLARERRERMANFSTEEDPNYSPMQMLKSRQEETDKNERDGVKSRVNNDRGIRGGQLTRHNADSNSGSHTRFAEKNEKDESRSKSLGGKAKLNVIHFDDEEEEVREPRNPNLTRLGASKRVYRSSSDDDDETRPKRTEAKSRQFTKLKKNNEASQNDAKALARQNNVPPNRTSNDNKANKNKVVTPKKRYYSSSEEEDNDAAKPIVQQKKSPRDKVSRKESPNKNKMSPAVKTRYYFSSSEDEDEDPSKQNNAGSSSNILSKFRSFDSDIWGEDEAPENKIGKSNKISEKFGKSNVDDKKFGKSNDADAKRREALKKRQKEAKGLENKRKDLIKQSLTSEQGQKGKKIVFSDDEKEQKSSLFDRDSDSGEEDEGNAFRVRSEFEGKGGEKLLSLQSRFSASDDRFRMDARFKDDHAGDGGDKAAQGEDEDAEKMSAEQEKRRNLSILEDIVGKSAVNRKKNNKKEFTDISQKRFDPLNVKRATMEIDKDPEDKEVVETVVEKKKREEAAPEVDGKKSFFLKSDAFSKQNNKNTNSFSFGFGGGNVDRDAEREEKSAQAINKSGKKSLAFLEKNPFKYDSSSSDEDEDDGDGKKGMLIGRYSNSREDELGRRLAAKAAAVSSTEGKGADKGQPSFSSRREPFFFDPTSADFQSEISEFILGKDGGRDDGGLDMDALRERHEKERPALAAALKKKVRREKARRKHSSFGKVNNNAESDKRRKKRVWRKGKKK